MALDEDTRVLYDEMYNVSRERFQRSLISGGVSHLPQKRGKADEQNAFNVLSMLTRSECSIILRTERVTDLSAPIVLILKPCAPEFH